MKLRTLLIAIFTSLFTAGIAVADDWGSWDDLPDNIFDDNNTNKNNLENIGELNSAGGSMLPEDLEAWLLELDGRLMLDDEEFQDLLEDLEGEDPDEIMEELEEWLEDQEDDLEDELDDAAKDDDD